MKILKVDLWIKFIIKWIESNAVKHATIDAKIDCGKFIFIEGLFIRSYVLKIREAKIMGTESYNGWTYWYCNIDGSAVPIDNLRQRFLSKNI